MGYYIFLINLLDGLIISNSLFRSKYTKNFAIGIDIYIWFG